MPDTTPVLALPYIMPSQAQKHVTHNEALRQLDAIVQLVVISADLSEPPLNPDPGDRYIVGDAAQGAWAGEEGAIAVADASGWLFFAAQEGWRADDLATGGQIRFDGASWYPVTMTFEDISQLGISTQSDEINRLAVASPATLLTHAGDDHQLKINKALPASTASLVFQTGWSGRAELGITGTDDFSIKVSANGNSFTPAVVIDRNTGALRAPSNPAFLAFSAGQWSTITTPHTDLPFDTEVLNRGGHFNPLTGRFTAPVDGLYGFLINGFLGSATNGRICFGINGTTQTMQMQVLVGAAPLSFTAVYALTAGQFVTCRTGNTNTNLTYFRSHTAFAGWLIS
jgi:hypothetical protein